MSPPCLKSSALRKKLHFLNKTYEPKKSCPLSHPSTAPLIVSFPQTHRPVQFYQTRSCLFSTLEHQRKFVPSLHGIFVFLSSHTKSFYVILVSAQMFLERPVTIQFKIYSHSAFISLTCLEFFKTIINIQYFLASLFGFHYFFHSYVSLMRLIILLFSLWLNLERLETCLSLVQISLTVIRKLPKDRKGQDEQNDFLSLEVFICRSTVDVVECNSST